MIIDYIIKNSDSVYSAAKKMGIPYSTLNDIVLEKSDIKKCSADTLYRLSKYCGISMETLFTGAENKNIFYIYNDGRKVNIVIGRKRYSYLGPKNLVSFREINKVYLNVIYVDTYFMDSNGTIIIEEDYIDLKDILTEYGDEELLSEQYEVVIRKEKRDIKAELIDLSLLVSDNFAMEYVSNSADKFWIKATNLSRTRMSCILQLDDKKIISSNMSDSMQKKAISAIVRNVELLKDEMTERGITYA